MATPRQRKARNRRRRQSVTENVIRNMSILTAFFVLFVILSNVARQTESDQSLVKESWEQLQVLVADFLPQQTELLVVEVGSDIPESAFPQISNGQTDLMDPAAELPQPGDGFVAEEYLAAVEAKDSEALKPLAEVPIDSEKAEPMPENEVKAVDIPAEQPPELIISQELPGEFLDEQTPLALSQQAEIEEVAPPAVPLAEKSGPVFGKLSIPEHEEGFQTKRIPLIGNNWSLLDLDDDVGILEGTGQFPGDEYSMVFAAHVTTVWPIRGPFGKLHRTSLGDEIRYDDGENIYVYKISRYIYAHPSRADLLFQQDGNQIILVTCNGYNFVSDNFDKRLITYATLDRVIPISTFEDLVSD